MEGKLIPKFRIFGEPITKAGILVQACPDDTILFGPTAKGFLPGMYKFKEHKEVDGIGMTYKLEVRKIFF